MWSCFVSTTAGVALEFSRRRSRSSSAATVACVAATLSASSWSCELSAFVARSSIAFSAAPQHETVVGGLDYSLSITLQQQQERTHARRAFGRVSSANDWPPAPGARLLLAQSAACRHAGVRGWSCRPLCGDCRTATTVSNALMRYYETVRALARGSSRAHLGRTRSCVLPLRSVKRSDRLGHCCRVTLSARRQLTGCCVLSLFPGLELLFGLCFQLRTELSKK